MTRATTHPLGVVYTPPEIARAMTRLALAPLVEGASSDAILAVRVCDPAAGAGAFLVEVVAYLAEHLVLAWKREGRAASALVDADDAGYIAGATFADARRDADDAGGIARSAPADAGGIVRSALDDPHDANDASGIVQSAFDVVDGGSIMRATIDDPRDADAWVREARDLVARQCIAGVDLDTHALDAARRALTSHEITRHLVTADALALDWRATFPEVFAAGGFDVVLANPPYIRQESLSAKSTLEGFEVFDGVADLYVYFIELAHRLLRPRGRYCVIVPNKWMTVDYGRSLRRFLASAYTVDGIADLSTHSLFADADAFPCIVWGTLGASRDREIAGLRAAAGESVDSVLRRAERSRSPGSTIDALPSPDAAPLAAPPSIDVPRSLDAPPSLGVPRSIAAPPSIDTPSSGSEDASPSSAHVGVHGGVHAISRERWGADPWHIDAASDRALLDRLAHAYPTLGEIIGTRWSRGVVTGLNAAFVIDRSTRDGLVASDPASTPWIRRFLKGRDIRPYAPATDPLAERWILLVDRGTPFESLPPPIRDHLTRFREQLEPRPADHVGAWSGRKPGTYAWYELQDPVVPLARSHAPRMFYQDIQTSPACSFDPDGELVPDTTVWILPSSDRYLLAILSSRLYHWYARRRFPPALNGAVRPKLAYMQRLPIPTPSRDLRREIEALVERRLASTQAARSASYPSTTERSVPTRSTSRAVSSDVSVLDAQIERLVETAYELSSIERALVAT